MAQKFADRVIETSSNTPGASGTVTVNLSGTSPSIPFIGGSSAAGRKFVDAYATTETALVSIYQTNDPTLWCIAECTFTTGSPNTLTFAAANVRDGSAGAGALVTWTSTVTCLVIPDAILVQATYFANRGYCEGGVASYSSTTAIAVSAWSGKLNGKWMSAAGATLTSGSTMKDIANSTVTIGASKAYNLFIFDNAGTAEFRVEERDNTGDGQDPVYDSDLDYWKGATTGAAARRIAKFSTDGSSHIIDFVLLVNGRQRRWVPKNSLSVVLLGSGNATTVANIVQTPYVGADTDFVDYLWTSKNTTTTGPVYALYYIDGGTSEHFRVQLSNAGNNVTDSLGKVCDVPYTGTLHYKVNPSTTQATLCVAGIGFRV